MVNTDLQYRMLLYELPNYIASQGNMLSEILD